MIRNFKEYILENIHDFDEKDINKISKHVAAEIGENIESYLGCGDYGYAYELKSGKVLKITSDKSEYEISNYLKNKNTTYLIGIYDVRDLKNGLFSIIMDQAIDPDRIEKAFLKHFLIAIKWIKRDISIQDISISKIKEIVTEWSNFTKYTIDDNKIKKMIKDLINIQKEASKYNINCSDLRGDNIGWIDDKFGRHLVFFDIGSGGEKEYKKTNKKLKPINIKTKPKYTGFSQAFKNME